MANSILKLREITQKKKNVAVKLLHKRWEVDHIYIYGIRKALNFLKKKPSLDSRGKGDKGHFGHFEGSKWNFTI